MKLSGKQALGSSAPSSSSTTTARCLEEIQLRYTAGLSERLGTPVRAASAIVPHGDGWLIAEDDSNFAACWRGPTITPLRLFPSAGSDTFSEAQGNKQHKPDLECGTRLMVGGRPAAVFFGSGSSSARMRAAVITGEKLDQLKVRGVAIPSFYTAVLQTTEIPSSKLNLEGACTVGEVVRFFQRGNDPRGANLNLSLDVDARALARTLEGRGALRSAQISNVKRYDLGSLDGAPLGFSAAETLPDGRVLVAASAEASPNAVDDGPVSGSVIFLLSREQELITRWRVPNGTNPIPRKIEGLALERLDGATAILRCVADADDPSRPSEAIRLSLELPPAS